MNTRTIQLAALSALVFILGGAGPLSPQVHQAETHDSVASPVDGKRLILGRVHSYSKWDRAIDLRGNEMTLITLVGDGKTDLDLFIYDAAGNLVVASEGRTDEEAVWVFPFQTGRYYIRIANLGRTSNSFSLLIE